MTSDESAGEAVPLLRRLRAIAPLVPRRIARLLLRPLPIALFAIWLTVFVLIRSSGTIFSISADTGVVEVRPLCGDKIVWDLPRGEIERRSCPPLPAGDSPRANWRKECIGEGAPVTVTMLPGASATIQVEGPDRWLVTFGVTGTDTARSRLASALRCPIDAPEGQLLLSGQDASGNLLEDKPWRELSGYFYRPCSAGAGDRPCSSDDGGPQDTLVPSEQNIAAAILRASADTPNLALVLTGRVIVGKEPQFGAGWQARPSPILSGAKIVARDRALLTREPLTTFDEEIEAGAIIDTHAEFAAILDAPDAETLLQRLSRSFMTLVKSVFVYVDRIERSSGFVQMFDDRLVVQVYQPKSIGVQPYDGLERIVKVPRWRPLWASPIVQLAASITVLLGGIAGLVFAYHEAAQKKFTRF